MKIYDFVSKTDKEVSLDKKNIKMYVCGPTVYNHVHIGNLRPIITFDVLNRLFLELGYTVAFIHNITDIDDKIVNKAKEENTDELKLSSYYESQYFDILKTINIHTSNMKFPRVSDHIKDIENYVEQILNNKFAYLVDGDVYFDTNKSNQYGKISNKKLDELLVGDKSEDNLKKINPQDFTLWKETTIGLNWNLKFSIGRPGWHTECSCLINKYLGDQIDIHGGGIDLKFPHHENENIQNIAVNNKDLARIWMHVGHLNINNQKMSKSLSNFILAKDLLSEYSANTVRWFFYQTSYSNPLNFTTENLINSKNQLENILYNLNIFKSNLTIEQKYNNKNLEFDKSCLTELINNFNLPNIVSFIEEKIKYGSTLLRNKKFDELNKLHFDISYLLTNILGIIYPDLFDKKAIELLNKWNKLKQEKNFSESDKYRKLLMEKKLL